MQNISTKKQLCAQAFANKNYSECVGLCVEILALDHFDIDTWNLAGITMIEIKEYARAIEYLSEGLHLARDKLKSLQVQVLHKNDELRAHLAPTTQEITESSEFIESNESAQSANSPLHESLRATLRLCEGLWLNLAEAYRRDSNPHEAIATLHQALEALPILNENPTLHFNLAKAYVDAGDSRAYASMGLDYHDIESVAEKSIASLLSSGYVRGIKQPKVLVISDIINDTMQNIDVEQLSRKITRDMRNSGKFKLSLAISGSGASGDKMIDSIRAKTRGNEEFDQYSVIEKGQLKGAQLSLSGKIWQKNVKVSGKQRTDYFFLLTLTDLATGEVVWDDEANIIKVGSNKSVSW